MRPTKLTLKKDTLAELDAAQLSGIAGGVQTLQSGCQSGVRSCFPDVTELFTHHSSLDCQPTDVCPTNGCG